MNNIYSLEELQECIEKEAEKSQRKEGFIKRLKNFFIVVKDLIQAYKANRDNDEY